MAGGQLPSSLRAPTISPTSPHHQVSNHSPWWQGRGRSSPHKAAGKSSTAPIHCGHPTQIQEAALTRISSCSLLPNPLPPPPLPQSQHPTPLSLRPSTSSTPYLHSAPCRTHHPAHKTRNPRASTKKTSAPTPSAGSLPQPGRGSPVVSPSAQPLSSHHSKTAGSISDVTCTRCWPKGYPAKC